MRVSSEPVKVCSSICPARCTPVWMIVSSTSEMIPKRASGPGTRTANGELSGPVTPRYSSASSTLPRCHGVSRSVA